MAREDDLPEDRRRLLDAFGYHWNKRSRVWVNRGLGRAVSQQTVREWTLDQLENWLTKDATRGK